MKKLFAIVAVMGVLTFGSTQLAQAQDAPAAEQTEQAAPAAQAAPADEAAAPVVAENAENTEGEMLEWLKRHAWKACIRQKCIRGSNPRLSA